MKKKYEILDHTADIGLKIEGKGLKQVFENAAAGMFELICGAKAVKPEKAFKIKIKAPDKEELLVSWLRELLYLHEAKRVLLRDFKVTKISDTSLEVLCKGEKLDLKRHALRTEIKAVTYHQLRIQKTKAGFKAQVIFDI